MQPIVAGPVDHVVSWRHKIQPFSTPPDCCLDRADTCLVKSALKYGKILPIGRHLLSDVRIHATQIDGFHAGCDILAGTSGPHLRRGAVILGRGGISLDTIPEALAALERTTTDAHAKGVQRRRSVCRR